MAPASKPIVALIKMKMMNKRQVRMTKVPKQVESIRRVQQERLHKTEQQSVQPIAPQAAYRRVQLHPTGSTPAEILALQRTVGNRRVQRMLALPGRLTVVSPRHTIQRDDVPLIAPNPEAGITVENWPNKLPRAVRTIDKKDPSKDENIKVKLGEKVKKDENTVIGPNDKEVKEWVKPAKGKSYQQEYVIHAPSLENAEKGLAGTLSNEQKAFVESIQKARDALNIDKLHLNLYAGQYGWQYGGQPKKDATPAQVQGTVDTSTVEGKRKQAEQWIWEELRFEGSSASINAYDSQMVTWGRGLGAATGGLNPAMNELFKDQEIVTTFKQVGVSFENNKWLAINTVTGAVEEGRNALAIMQTDPHILAAMIEIGENAKFKQAVADAQWKAIKEHGTAKVPDYALDWDKEVIQLVAHITHWGPAYGWHKASAGYEESGGDPLEVVLHFFRTAAGKPNKNNSLSIRKMGPDTIANFSHWGSGIGLKTIKDNFDEEDLTNKDIDDNEDYRGYYILKRSNADKSGKMPCYVYDAGE